MWPQIESNFYFEKLTAIYLRVKWGEGEMESAIERNGNTFGSNDALIITLNAISSEICQIYARERGEYA